MSESYRRSGTEEKLRAWEEHQFTPETRWWMGNAALLVQIANERQIVFKWDF